MRKAIEQVTAFHRAFGHTVALDKIASQHRTVRGMAEARAAWIVEERDEIHEAFYDKDKVKFADGLADMRYFILGSAVAFGVAGADDHGLQVDALVELLDTVAEAVNGAYRFQSARTQALETLKAEIVLRGIASLYGIPLDDVFTLVHEKGNMAKLGPDGKPILHPETGKVIKPEGWVAPDAAIAELLGDAPLSIV